jgi:hypothetical protein
MVRDKSLLEILVPQHMTNGSEGHKVESPDEIAQAMSSNRSQHI